jgi:hypothetical protein
MAERKARRLKAIAAYINATYRTKLRAAVERTTVSTDRKIGRLCWPGKGRTGNRLIVKHVRTGKVLFDHNAAETYRSNDEVERWLADWEKAHG